MKSRATTLKRKSNVRRQRDPIPWKYCLLTLVCGMFLVAGFFYAARSHFATMDYGMKNAKLRKQIDELQSENQRLKLSKEMALTPSEIKKAANKLGFTTMTADNIESVKTKSEKVDKTEIAQTKKDSKPKVEINSLEKEVLSEKEKSESNNSIEKTGKDGKKTKDELNSKKSKVQIAKK